MTTRAKGGVFAGIAPEGNGCDHCETGRPIERVELERFGRVIELCLECVMEWFPNKTIEWWEARHTHFADHVEERIRAAAEKELKAAEQARQARATMMRGGQ